MQTITKICNAKIYEDNEIYDIDIHEGLISNIKPSASPSEPGRRQIDARSILDAEHKIVLPGLIDAHTHIDKSFSPITNISGTLSGAISAMADYKKARDLKTIKNNADKAIKLAISHGVSLLRSHIDLNNHRDLDTVSMMIELKQDYKKIIDLEFSVLGSTEKPEDIQLMRQALDIGADMIGGAPSLNQNPHVAIKNAIELALERGKGLDLHIDEKESTEILALEILAEQCQAYGFEHPVVASHCVSLAYLDKESLKRLIETLYEAQISIIALPVCNLNLMGRQQIPSTRGITPIKTLMNAGINVSVASDNVQDPFNPFGNYDPMQALNTACFAGHMSSKAELIKGVDLITKNPAQAFKKSQYGINVGCEASLLITNSESFYDCCVQIPERLANVKKGLLVYRKSISETWY